MNVKELREYLDGLPDTAKVEVVVNNHPENYTLAWGGADGGTKATAHDIAFMVGGTNESAQRKVDDKRPITNNQ